MKARDIIPGWPRGRTTTSLYCPIMPFFIAFGALDAKGRMDFIADFRANAEYHESQRRMVWSIWEQYRRVEFGFAFPLHPLAPDFKAET